MRTIAVLQPLKEGDLERLQAVAPGWEVAACAGAPEQWLPTVKRAEAIIGWKPEAEEACCASGGSLRWIQAWGAGVDKLPLGKLEQAGVIVTTASGVHPNPVSETAFAMMLAFSRKLHESVRHQRDRRWVQTAGLGEIHGKTLGVVGVGIIGSELARLGKAFNMNVVGVRHSGAPADYVDTMYTADRLSELLQTSDYVVAIMPLTDETYHMFGAEQFRSMKRTAYFINVSRGATTDTEALIDALRSGEIAGAGLDVFEQEPLPSEHPLWEMDNVIMTPHNGGVTDVYYERALDIVLGNLRLYVGGATEAELRNRVDLTKQY